MRGRILHPLSLLATSSKGAPVALSAFLALGALGCGEGSAAPTKTEQPIRNGTDSSQTWAVYIGGGTGGSCTGVLITPSYVMTAAHCARSFGDNVQSLNIRNDPTGATTAPIIGTYTRGHLGASHVMRRWGSGEVDLGGNWSAAATDVALIPLDDLVPPSVAQPLRLPTSHCGAFTGHYFGYGDGDFLTFPSASPVESQRQGIGPVVPQDKMLVREFEALSLLFSEIPGLGDVLAILNGEVNDQVLNQGDSGGPLNKLPSLAEGYHLCGIASRVWFEPIDCTFQLAIPPWLCQMEFENHWADVSRSDAKAWYTPKITDSKMRLKGTCDEEPVALQTTDADGDTIPDACDPCPHVTDNDYDLTATPDTDDDGIPDRCDSCPTVANRLVNGTQAPPDDDSDGIGNDCDFCRNDPTQENCNLEAELTASYGGLSLTAPPVIFFDAARNPFGEDYAIALARYQGAFRVGTCEIAPCPEFDSEPTRLPIARRSPEPLQDCPVDLRDPNNIQTGCRGATGTHLIHTPIPSDTVRNLEATVQMKWCNCTLQVNRETLAGRVACQEDFGCRGTPERFDDTRFWQDIRTAQWLGDDGHGTFQDAEIGTYVLLSGTTPRHRTWDYLALSPLFITNLQIQGVMWNNVREIPLSSPSFQDLFRERGSSFHSGDVVPRLVPRGPATTVIGPGLNPCVIQLSVCDLGTRCLTCLPGRGTILDRMIQRPDGGVGDLIRVPSVVGPGGFTTTADLFTPAARDALDPAVSGTTLRPVVQSEPDLRRLASERALGEKVAVLVGPGSDIDPGVVVRSAFVRNDDGAPIDLVPLSAANRGSLFRGLSASPLAKLFPAKPKCGEVQIQAGRTFAPSSFADGATDTRRSQYAVPEQIAILAGNAGNQVATLTIGDRLGGTEETCQYRGQASVQHPTERNDVRAGLSYFLQSCSRGSVAGGLVTADSFRLHIDGADNSSPTTTAMASIYEQQPCAFVPLPPDDPDPRIASVTQCDTVELSSFVRHDIPNTPRVPRHPRPGTVVRILDERQDLAFAAEHRLPQARRFALPAEIPVTAGRAGDGRATLTFQNGELGPITTCEYRARTRHGRHGWSHGPSHGSQAFVLRSCDGVFEAGDILQADRLKLEVLGGDRSRPVTMAKLTLSEVGPCGAVIGPEAILDTEGLVYSSSRAEVYVFGGTRRSELNPAAWVYSLKNDEWVEIGLERHHRPADVLAATYRQENGTLYVVDRHSRDDRLLSWDGRSNRFEALGTWSNRWHEARFERRWLVAGVAGDLFYVGSKERLSVFVRLGLEEGGRLRVLGVKEIRKPVFGRPIPMPDALAYTTVEEREDGQHPLQEVAPFDTFRRPHRGHRFSHHGDDWLPRL